MAEALTDAEWDELRAESRQTLPEALDASRGLPAVLLRYQAKLLATTAVTQLVVCEKSRRIGMTWAVAADATLTAGSQRAAGGMDVLYIGYNLDMAREFIDTCAMWARAFIPAASGVEEFLFKDQGEGGEDKDINAFRIKFASGYEIVALTSKPRSLRGRQGFVIFDEAAFHDELAELLKAAMALLMWGGKVLVISTHDGADNPFNLLVRDIRSGERAGEVVTVTFEDAIEDGLYERIALTTGKSDTAEAKQAWIDSIMAFYGQDADEELHCIPKAGSGVWLSAPLIEARMTAEAPVLTLELPGDYLQRTDADRAELMRPFMAELEAALSLLDLEPHYAAGFDFARVADLSVLSLLSIEKNLHRREALSIELRNVPGQEQIAIVGDVLSSVRPRLLGAAFDATGMGWIVAEEMGRRFGLRENEDSGGLIWAIKFSEDWYRQHMPPLKKAFEDGTLWLGPSDDHVTDLRIVRELRGVPRVPPVRTGEKGLKRHGDYAIGLALAHFASRMRWVQYDYRAVSAPTSAGDVPDEAYAPRPWYRQPLGAGLRGGI
ncbi:hypothetical protein CEW88_04895 [Alloyangia pacifica]|uniref:Mu-like prophage FluMu protein gp28 n=1 Tax=Alloyangia pacifica TaxID=311180 RepID=A0A2U8HDF7_9RHOB|nr:terminase family protein [Alloyangia pacifica]AWI83056.1 hypothetical protein CEW88_04895 [Alloyangia pacifica]